MGIVLWGRRSAFNVQKVLWLLGELGLALEHRPAGGAHGGLDTSEFRALNPHGRVPVVADGATIVWESHAILRYLAASYGAESLWSPDPAARSHADRWMDWSQCTLQPAFMKLFWGYFRTPAAQRDAAALELACRECEAAFDALDAQLARHRFLAGDAFSLADIPSGTALYRYFEMGVPVRRPPHVDRWYAELAARAPYRSAVLVPFEELRGRLEY